MHTRPAVIETLSIKKITSALAASAMLSLTLWPNLSTAIPANPADSERVIPYPAGYDTTSSGASSYEKIGDATDSPYFKSPDFFTLQSNDRLSILSQYQTYQQTTEYTCGPAAALTVLNRFGMQSKDELTLAKLMGTNDEVGTTPAQMADYFKSIGWQVESSVGRAAGTLSFPESSDFREFAITQIKAGHPILIDWVDWAGHWVTIVGYDTMGTEGIGDDIVIVSDPYDTSDHKQDGYGIMNAERFYEMWFEGDSTSDGQKKRQQWVVAHPK